MGLSTSTKNNQYNNIYTNMKIIIPESWNEITIKQYVKLTQIPKGMSESESLIELLHIITDVSKQELGTIDIGELDKINEALAWIISSPSVEDVKKEFKIKDETFSYNRKFDKMTMGEMVSYEMLLERHKLTNIETIPYMLAIILRTKDEAGDMQVFNSDTVYDRVELFENNLTIGETMGLLFFFKNGGRDYMTVLEDSLKQLREMKTEIMKN